MLSIVPANGDEVNENFFQGTVRDQDTGAPIANVCIAVLANDGTFLGSGASDSTGAFSALYSLPLRSNVTSMRVTFDNCPFPVGNSWAPRTFQTPMDRSGVPSVVELVDDDAIVTPGAFNGLAVDARTNERVSVCASAQAGLSGHGAGSVGDWGDRLGSISFPSLEAGTYRVVVDDCPWDRDNYPRRVIDNVVVTWGGHTSLGTVPMGTPLPPTPTAPTKLRAEGTKQTLQIHWKAPASTGGKPILRYDITVAGNGWQGQAQVGPKKSSHAMKALPSGSYTATVRAVTANGNGTSATSGAVCVGTKAFCR